MTPLLFASVSSLRPPVAGPISGYNPRQAFGITAIDGFTGNAWLVSAPFTQRSGGFALSAACVGRLRALAVRCANTRQGAALLPLKTHLGVAADFSRRTYSHQIRGPSSCLRSQGPSVESPFHFKITATEYPKMLRRFMLPPAMPRSLSPSTCFFPPILQRRSL